ncbi:ATP-binding protein [bacterium]|jgi:signal transduction histidine kinase|nr:ATP-binding protein [bacterium]MDA7510770.1 ATP-binding protein [Verrucomicrobiota bacterium]MDA7657411.1 ATP-binding protein [Verrucomicrobiota bacterium]MDA7680474.1 ATP-binding protein [bacterium]
MANLGISKLFECLNDAELATIGQAVDIKRFNNADIIFREGDSGDGIYVVAEGTVLISALLNGETRCDLSRLTKGDFFGEMAVIDSGPRSATASAGESTVVFFVRRDEILKLLERSPAFSLTLIKEVTRRIREFNRKYVEEILQAERLTLVGRFARSIVHDFKNPLNVIRIASEMGAMEEATPEMRKMGSERVCKQVDRLSNMINELMEFTRGSHTTVIMSPSNYHRFIKQFIEEYHQEVRDKGSELVLVNEPPDVEVFFEPQRLSHVFSNLINNALDEMPAGGKVRIRFKVTATALITEIEDSGKGISPEIEPQLFDAFSTFGKKQGTGLGLSICKRIITDHDGEIEARNSPDGGAIFSFSLPLPTAPKEPS